MGNFLSVETLPSKQGDQHIINFPGVNLVSAGRMTQKCDVYSFGVVLLELLTGQEPVNTNSNRTVGPTMLVDDFSHLLQQWKLEELKVKNRDGRSPFYSALTSTGMPSPGSRNGGLSLREHMRV